MTARLRHTPCAQPIDFTPDQQLLEPDTDQPHQCPVPEGQFRVIRHWNRWSISDALDPWKPQRVFDTQAEAQAEATRRNTPRTSAPRPHQDALFNDQQGDRRG